MSVMLAQAISLGDLNLYDLIFKTILQLPQCTSDGTWGCINGVFAHDFIYGLFLPHIVILIFLYLGVKSVPHRGIGSLLGIGIYTFIIYSGWYALLSSLTIFWIILTIFITGFYFFFGRIFHPSRSDQIFKLAYGKAKSGAEKRKTEQSLVSDIAFLKKRLKDARKSGLTSDEIKELAKQLTARELQLRELQRR